MPSRFWTLNLIITRRVLYHCAAPVGTFTRNKTFPFRIPVFFLATFQVLVCFLTHPWELNRFQIWNWGERNKKVFLQIVEDNLPDKKLFRFLFFSFEKNKLSSNLLKLFSFLSLFYFGANYILFYFKTFLLLLLLRQFRFNDGHGFQRNVELNPWEKKFQPACSLRHSFYQSQDWAEEKVW